jgi:hypothetical protein
MTFGISAAPTSTLTGVPSVLGDSPADNNKTRQLDDVAGLVSLSPEPLNIGRTIAQVGGDLLMAQLQRRKSDGDLIGFSTELYMRSVEKSAETERKAGREQLWYSVGAGIGNIAGTAVSVGLQKNGADLQRKSLFTNVKRHNQARAFLDANKGSLSKAVEAAVRKWARTWNRRHEDVLATVSKRHAQAMGMNAVTSAGGGFVHGMSESNSAEHRAEQKNYDASSKVADQVIQGYRHSREVTDGEADKLQSLIRDYDSQIRETMSYIAGNMKV